METVVQYPTDAVVERFVIQCDRACQQQLGNRGITNMLKTAAMLLRAMQRTGGDSSPKEEELARLQKDLEDARTLLYASEQVVFSEMKQRQRQEQHIQELSERLDSTFESLSGNIDPWERVEEAKIDNSDLRQILKGIQEREAIALQKLGKEI